MHTCIRFVLALLFLGARSKTRGAFSRATIMVTAAALLVTLVAGSPHSPSITRAARDATSPPVTLFSDGFESGSFAAWSAVKTGAGGPATVQTSVVKSGTYAAQLSETSTAGSYAYAREALTQAQTDLDVSGDFDTTGEGASGSNVRFVRLFDPSGALVVSLYRQNGSGTVGLQYPAGGPYYTASGSVALSVWTHVELHVVTTGSGASTVQVWLNGSAIYQTTTASLGTAGVATVQVGNDTKAPPRMFTLVADNVSVNVGMPAPTPPPSP